MRKLKSEIQASIKNRKINVFFIFLFSAFIILILTKLSKPHTNTIAFGIEKHNVPLDNIILDDSLMLHITLKTHGFKWLKYYMSPPKINIDFGKDVYKKEGGLVWSKSEAYLNNTQFDKEVEVLNITPDTLRFRYGINLVKKVPVKLKTAINFEPGYNMSRALVLEPDSIVVIGPDILVSEIKFIETEQMVFNNIRTDFKEQVKLKLPKNNLDLKFSNQEVLLKTSVERFTEGVLNVPITIINVPKGVTIKYFPKTVKVSYYVSLKDYKFITNADFKVICDYSKTSENQSFLTPELIKIPEKIKNEKINQQHIEFIITK